MRPDETPEFSAADVRAAVAAGTLTEAQAATFLAVVRDRAGKRRGLPAEDEPFEFFRGFSEIFVSVGLLILMGGIIGLLTAFGGFAMLALLPLACAAIAWWWATYFTLRRRMNLPSMVLVTLFGGGIYVSALTILGVDGSQVRLPFVVAGTLTAVALALWYRTFRLPFTAFLIGLAGLGVVYAATASLTNLTELAMGETAGLGALFDLRNSPTFALATLSFGIVCFLAAMWFDTRDPYRLGRHAATGFWLHLLAAPALVNTVAFTLLNIGGAGGYLALTGALTVIALLALVIDRRSFLTAAIIYIAAVLGWLIADSDVANIGGYITVTLILGAFITALGTWWVPLRAGLMRALPAFPGKDRLPPYGTTA
jgi:hypothetical protein